MPSCSDNTIRWMYDLSVRIPLLWELDALVGGATAGSAYRERAIAALEIGPGATVLDAACGTGINFVLLQRHLGGEGRLVGVDLSSGVLGEARRRVAERGWSNVELVQASLTDLAPAACFDAALCTFAMTIVSDHRAVIDALWGLLEPGGRLSVLAIQLSTWPGYRLLNPLAALVYRLFAVDTGRDVVGAIRARFGEVRREECFGGFYALLSARKRA